MKNYLKNKKIIFLLCFVILVFSGLYVLKIDNDKFKVISISEVLPDEVINNAKKLLDRCYINYQIRNRKDGHTIAVDISNKYKYDQAERLILRASYPDQDPRVGFEIFGNIEEEENQDIKHIECFNNTHKKLKTSELKKSIQCQLEKINQLKKGTPLKEYSKLVKEISEHISQILNNIEGVEKVVLIEQESNIQDCESYKKSFLSIYIKHKIGSNVPDESIIKIKNLLIESVFNLNRENIRILK
jgi:flagellar biosynthesis/type III secretory pathway M-ring protein FliF/YscJ